MFVDHVLVPTAPTLVIAERSSLVLPSAATALGLIDNTWGPHHFTGIYPPQVRVFELSELSLKFERHLTSEIVDFQVLPPDCPL